MIRRHMIMSAAMTALALSSCGGGKDDATATPTPTTTPTPTPTSTASPTYGAFPLTAAGEVSTIDAITSFSGTLGAGAVTLGVAGTEQLSTRVRLALDPAVATSGNTTALVVIRENAEESRFTSANLATQPVPANSEYVFRTDSTTTAGQFSQLELLNNTIPSQVTSDAGLALTNVTYANWYRGDSTAGAKRLTYTVFGYPTALTDVPTTGVQAYSARVTGRLVSVTGATSSLVKVTGTVTASVNFGTGLVDLTLALTTPTGAGGAQVAYGTFTAQGAIPVGNNQFTGSFSQGSPLSGTIAGSFYGSQGKEIGITFAASGTFGGSTQRLVGVVVGKKP